MDERANYKTLAEGLVILTTIAAAGVGIIVGHRYDVYYGIGAFVLSWPIFMLIGTELVV